VRLLAWASAAGSAATSAAAVNEYFMAREDGILVYWWGKSRHTRREGKEWGNKPDNAGPYEASLFGRVWCFGGGGRHAIAVVDFHRFNLSRRVAFARRHEDRETTCLRLPDMHEREPRRYGPDAGRPT
jgi:hypothetical protein